MFDYPRWNYENQLERGQRVVGGRGGRMMFRLSRGWRRFSLLFLLGLTFWLLLETRVLAFLVLVVTPGTNVVIAKSLTNIKTKAEPWEIRSQVEPGNEGNEGNETEASMRVQQGLRLYEAGKITAAINVWSQALGQISNTLDRAIVQTNLALAYRQIGNLNEAVQQWEQAIQIYRGQRNEATQQTLAQLLVKGKLIAIWDSNNGGFNCCNLLYKLLVKLI
ncbi:tetratricopeptide repeat protein [Microseira wollei]|uniref:Rapsyn myristoylation/linker region N-terminal domain-containing protein n=1 Tax=Microseira wollei NIES-4236 TaxID=2530354 RepID=A0AAV3X974_9CYAN|nr:tetratricopeptide repeat protein [Microseira wollei]GET36625.1 hypothetical protein MiSe_13760 [Microseira wollei NIES-4236]